MDMGCDIFTLKSLMGHKSLGTTSRYIHITGVRKGIKSPLDTIFGFGKENQWAQG